MPILFSKRVFAAAIALLLAVLPAAAEGVQLKTVVIDPGHGGHDAGAISLDGKLMEKNVVLDVSLQLGKKIKAAYPDVKVIYTRDTDVFIPLNKRADIANKAHADLFISIHCNSVPKTSKAPTGCETWVMGMGKSDANMEVCKTENSVILLEDDYTTKYQGFDPNDSESYILFNLMQNAYFEQSLTFADMCQKQLRKGPIPTNRGIKQGGLMVLWRTTMPSVLVELGFITNAGDRATLGDKAKRGDLAGSLFKAFAEFKKQYESGDIETQEEPGRPEVAEDEQTEPDKETARPAESTGSPTPGEDNTEPAPAPQPKTYYAVQIFAISKELEGNSPQFKGEKDIHRFPVGSVFKYTVGVFKNENDAQDAARRLSDKFPGCFVVKVDNFKIIKK